MAHALPLLLLPGQMNDEGVWRHQLDHLGEVADPRYVSLLQRESIADMATAVLDDAPPRFAVAGFSMGGYVAFELLRRAPERVIGVAFVSSSAHPDMPERAAERQGHVKMVEAGDYEKMFEDEFLLRLKDKPALAEQTRATLLRLGPEEFIRQSNTCMTRPDSRPDLPGIACPAIAICGRQDDVLPLSRSEEIVAGIPGARLAVIEDCGHSAPTERPQATTALLRYWLAGL
ncbi:MAG: alpha/beta fold hydrolase [Rhodospirillaceae bacterium]|jgi:pimeloyl-ACP methyl ester carboxylesterase|nr:alpha/beta fold hydrolase [Rhodospirillaceae bacterium]MBT6116390.1 alpha/beta fold hydrolase [Rhodospirillaceae bacterium]